MTEKLNPETTVATTNARWLGLGSLAVLFGVAVGRAMLVRARSRRPSRPTLLDLALTAAGIVGLYAVTERLLPRGAWTPPARVKARTKPRGHAVTAPSVDEADETERFSHPAVNVQRISFA